MQNEYIEKFKTMGDDQLVEAFNREVGNTGWVGTRASYLATLRQTFNDRGFDYADIGDRAVSSSQKK